jgi:MFS family permease
LFSRIVDTKSAYSLIFTRVIYAINWYNIASLFAQMATDLHQNVSGLGLITAAFYIGLGVFQVPGGILAARIGPRKTAVIGTVIASAASLSIALVTDLYQVVLLRLLVGLGMAFVFAPGVILVSRTVTKGSEGFAVGLYNSAFYLGGVLGLFGWAVLGEFAGWRTSLLFSGGLGLLSALLLIAVLPKDVRRTEFRIMPSHLRTVLLDPWLIVVSITLLALGVGSTIFSSFVPYYAHQSLGMQSSFAGALGGLGVLFAFVFSPLAGRIYDTFRNIKRLLFYTGILMAVGISLSVFSSVFATAISGVLIGVASGGFTLGFSSARESVKIEPEYETLAVSWVNSVSLFGDFVPPLIFSATVLGYGYGLAWVVSGILTAVLLIPLLVARSPQRSSVKQSPQAPVEIN